MDAEPVDDASLPPQLGGHFFHGVVRVIRNVADSVRMKSDGIAAVLELQQDVGAVGRALFGDLGGFPGCDGAVSMKELCSRANIADIAIEGLLARHQARTLEVES